jgi:hypothetical protein
VARLKAAETFIPRRPDRPSDYARYALPVAASGSPKVVASDPTSNGDSGVVRAGISIAATPTTPVLAPALDGQEGPARIVFAGTLVEQSIATLHTVRTSDRASDYLVIVGRLAGSNALVRKTDVAADTPLGTVGGSPVYLETRLVRPGVDPFVVPTERLLDDSVSVPVDPRNVLRLRD